MLTIIVFLKKLFLQYLPFQVSNYLFAPFPSFPLAFILHLILNCWFYPVSLPRYAFYLRGWLKTFNKKLYMQKNFVSSKYLYKHEVSLTNFNISPAPSNSDSLPDCSLKLPGGKGIKKYQWLFFLSPLLSSLLCTPSTPVVSNALLNWWCPLLYLKYRLLPRTPDPSISAVLLDLSPGMSHSNSKVNALQTKLKHHLLLLQTSSPPTLCLLLPMTLALTFP